MEKSKILIVGCGGCGNRQLSELLELDKRFTGIFFNTNMSEMEKLPHFNKERRCFYIPNADGTGKDRNLSEIYIKEEAPKLAEKIKKFNDQDTVYFFAGVGGGTGSKAIIMLPKLVKKLCPEKSLNIIATFPRMNDDSDIDYENAVDTWNELIELKNKRIIDSFQFIDNNKLSSEKEVNKRAMVEFNDGFDVVGGKIDSTDSKRVHCTKGYKVVLNLDNSIRDTKECIDKAIKTSVYYMPENFECDTMIGNININKINLKTIRDEFESYSFSKINENEDNEKSILVLGGCETPREPIELVKEYLKELKFKKKKRVIEEDLIVKKHQTDNEESTNHKLIDTKTKLSSKDLNDMFADDSFWND